MDAVPIAEGFVALIAGIGAWLSWKANTAANRASREAEGANRAVNCNKDPKAPRLYDIVAKNARKTAVVEERVNGIREKQISMARRVDKLSTGHAVHKEILKSHSEKLKNE